MDIDLLRKHLKEYSEHLRVPDANRDQDMADRRERTLDYQSWTAARIRQMDESELYNYVSKLWAMLIWGNKRYVVDKLIADNGFSELKEGLADLIWGTVGIEQRWDAFKAQIKGMGPAMMSELLCQVHPQKYMLWNRRAFVALRYLGVNGLPRYNYQVTGSKYRELSEVARKIADEMINHGIADADLLAVDYFIWEELQVEENLSQIYTKGTPTPGPPDVDKVDNQTSEFIHNEIRDKLADIGQWLGFQAQTEIKVADGSKVDTVWESTIGNMGRVIYVFEVQTKGSLDSLILNLLKSLNNPAVQGVVAVSDWPQLEKIKKHVAGVAGLREKLKYWNYEEILQVHDSLESVNESINRLDLVPQGF